MILRKNHVAIKPKRGDFWWASCNQLKTCQEQFPKTDRNEFEPVSAFNTISCSFLACQTGNCAAIEIIENYTFLARKDQSNTVDRCTEVPHPIQLQPRVNDGALDGGVEGWSLNTWHKKKDRWYPWAWLNRSCSCFRWHEIIFTYFLYRERSELNGKEPTYRIFDGELKFRRVLIINLSGPLLHSSSGK